MTERLRRPVSGAPLVTLRIGFGLMMFLSVVRFWYHGWIEKLYLEPSYFFSYRYFEWVKPLGEWTYGLFALLGLTALLVAAGRFFRPAATVFFLAWTYAELMDKTTYLNHYYFVSILALSLLVLPVPRGLGWRTPVPAWSIYAPRVLVGVVYFYAGLAKLNSDWLLEAMPLAIWLPAKYDLPGLGDFVHHRWVHYAFSWAGAAFDLLVPFALLWHRSRVPAYLAVVVFHVLTRVLFPIGMFPYVMIVSALVFFPPAVHERWLGRIFGRGRGSSAVEKAPGSNFGARGGAIATILCLHLLLPWRYLLYPGELFWTESGYRFSWRVMLMEKAGYVSYRVVDTASGRRWQPDLDDYLTTFQQKQLATQPDFLREFAHFLARESTFAAPAVYADSYVALNGRLSQPYVDPSVDLLTVDPHEPRTNWLMPFNDTIHGF